jgi:hypothetical protein
MTITNEHCSRATAATEFGGPTTVVNVCEETGRTGLERTRFFSRQLVKPNDLTQDQIYFRDKLRRHNRLLHGWGVVCGARCKWIAGDRNVTIEPGYILDPYGDEIFIPDEQVIDISKQNLDGNTFSGCGELTDPWCKDMRATHKAGHTYYLAVRYDECLTRPVSIPSLECGCSSNCEYTRIRDSFVIQVLEKLPESHKDMKIPNLLTAFTCNNPAQARSYPPCPSDPWVILADFTLSSDGSIASLDCSAHRRYVVSWVNYFFTCRDEKKYAILGQIKDLLNDASFDRLIADLSDSKPIDPSAIVIGDLRISSTINKELAKKTVGSVCAENQEVFIKKITKGLTGNKAEVAKAQAQDIWKIANKVANLFTSN